MSSTVLTGNFVNELFKKCCKSTTVFATTREFLKYNYLPSEEYKEVWKIMNEHYDLTQKAITQGLLTEHFNEYPDRSKAMIMKVLSAIRTADLPDDQSILDQLQLFIKNKIFIEAYDSLSDLFNKGDKDQAFVLMGEVADQLKDFNIRSDKYFTKLLDGFMSRHQERVYQRNQDKITPHKRQYIPFGIGPLDQMTRGGTKRGDTTLIMAPSGVGKSKYLKWCGLSAARRGFKGLHVQLEGSGKETEDAYDAGFMGMNYHQLPYLELDTSTQKQVEKTLEQIKFFGGEIYIKAYEQFDTASYKDFRDYVQEILDSGVELDFIVVDYLELAEPGNGKKYFTNNEGERARRIACAEAFKNICVEFDIAGLAATQSNTPSPKELNDPEFILTRYNVSESKGVIKPFSNFITLNQTSDEKRENTMRLFVDKARWVNQSQTPIVHIATDFDNERFYNHEKTMSLFGYEQ